MKFEPMDIGCYCLIGGRPTLPAAGVGGDDHGEVIWGGFIHDHHADVVRPIMQKVGSEVGKGFERRPNSTAAMGKCFNRRIGWAPHQMLAWQGFKNYGFDADAGRLAYRWLYTIAKNAHDYNGMIPEKYNAVTGSHDVFVEYGNVGTKFSYIATEGFGWMNASFEVGLNFLSPAQLADLHALKPPPAK